MGPVEPSLGGESFSCPHCAAFAHQTWFMLGLVNFDRGSTPRVIRYEEVNEAKQSKDDDDDDAEAKKWEAFRKRLEKNIVTYYYSKYRNTENIFVNFFVSECFACKGFAIWVEDRIVYPVKDTSITAHLMMPARVKEDFEEAASIVNRSPRGAAALLRLCVQKLMVELGEAGKNINDDIASQVRKGLEVEVQPALDVVRVIGNHAVHPGQIDLKDDKATAVTLFELLNMIVERRIAAPEKLKTLFAQLPQGARDQIQKRDAP